MTSSWCLKNTLLTDAWLLMFKAYLVVSFMSTIISEWDYHVCIFVHYEDRILNFPLMIYWYLPRSPWLHTVHKSMSWWRYQMETFPRYWPFVCGIHRWPVNSPHKGEWRGALVFTLIFAWINGWVNNGEAGIFETPSRLLWRHRNDSCCLFQLR